ncbi:MAG: hypothetical protein Q9173_003600 [Seirophora scorigena]
MLPLLRLTVSELQHLLNTTSLTSQNLFLQYLQVSSHNHAGAFLNAIISIPSYAQVLARAKLFDEERSQSESRRGRGPLHGIPIVLSPERQQAIKDAGAILVARANPTEPSHRKGIKLTSGWSAVGGQTQSSYVRGGVGNDAMPLGHSTPAGSSSGSAVAVAAGFCPVAIGTEIDGSVMCPAPRAGLYGCKPSRGKTDYTGVQPGGKPYDIIGVMAKGCEDIASVTNVLMDEQLQLRLGESWKGVKNGLGDLREWWLPEP